MKTKSLLLAYLLLICGIQLNGQTEDRKLGLGLHGGVNQYNGDLGNRLFKYTNPFYGYGALTLSYYLSPSFNIGLHGSLGDMGYSNSNLTMLTRKSDLSLLVYYKLNNGKILPTDSKWEPFATAGIGMAGYSGSRFGTIVRDGYRINDRLIPMGVGVKYYLNEKWAVQYQFLYVLTNHDVRDQIFTLPKENDRNDHFAQQSVGIIWHFGKSKGPDSDKDGIPDASDKCPNTEKGMAVDTTGCPKDSDKDGIADHLDKCPDVYGSQAAAGCPDRDNDGIVDKEDQCPDLAGKADFKGCPDTDGDGIPDNTDACPKVAGKTEFNGCPDSDGDGIVDSEDECPMNSGSKELKGCPDRDKDGVADKNDPCPDEAGKVNGCPDRDNDGIADKDDKCPGAAGTKANKGCPEVDENTRHILEMALTGVQFESGKDIIKTSSYSILDNIVTIMKDHPEFHLHISGHTDSQGDAQKNQVLSENRAKAVKKYIADKGVVESRLIADGFGSTQPITTNDTPAGRAKNRRVEFKVEFHD